MSNFVDIFNESKKDKTIKDKIKDKIKSKTSKDECNTKECKEDFHFGPKFDSAYLEHVLDIKEENEEIFGESTYDGSAIENDEDPTDPSLDDIVAMEPDIAANYHFGPRFGQDIFTKSTLKHSKI